MMRRIIELLHVHVLLLCLLVSVHANVDPAYDPSYNFRPDNVTGLGMFYRNVGSYYNGTTEIQLMPAIGPDVDSEFCFKLRNHTEAMQFNSILSVTERGPYNSGGNTFNFWLALVPPNYNVSSAPAWGYFAKAPLNFIVKSTEPVVYPEEHSAVEDAMNFTTVQGPRGSYSVSANSIESHAARTWIDNVTMPVCDTAKFIGNYSVGMYTNTFSSSIAGWEAFRLPDLNLQFDSQAATLTVNGSFIASPYIRLNASLALGLDGVGLGWPVQGQIQIRFSGVLDEYHSDNLTVAARGPSWVKTVGFGNNPLNIGYSSWADRLHFGSVKLITALAVLIGVAC